MSQNRIPIIQRVSQSLREHSAVDIYAMVNDLKGEFPNVAEADLERIVSEEVVAAGANAVWEKRYR